MRQFNEIWKIVFIYLLFASCWIIFSDNILQWFVQSSDDFAKWSVIKGLAFVITTSVLLFFLIVQYKRKIDRSIAALHEGEKRFHFLVENSSDCFAIINKDGVQRYVSHGAELLFGFPRSELEGKEINEVVHPDDLSTVLEAWERCLQEPENSVDVQYRHIHKNGGWIDCEAVARNFLNDPSIAGVIASVRDVSKRKQSEAALKRRNHFINTILDNLPIGLAVNRISEGTAIYMNKKFEEIYGWPKEELRNIDDFFEKVYPDETYRNSIKTDVMKDIESGDPKRMSWEGFQATCKNGQKKIIAAKNIPIYEQELMISTVQDITESQRLQKQLSQAQKLESVGRLAGGVAHDLNNLLTPIIGYSEMLLDDLEKEGEHHESVSEIFRAGERARDLVHQLLAFSRKQVLEFKPLDINETVNSFKKLLRRTIPEDIEIKTVLRSDIPKIKGDAGQIEQILMNLSVNAADAMPDGGELTIETEIVELDGDYTIEKQGVTPGTYVMLAVSDTGCGMKSEIVEKIFEPFFSTKGDQGTGLGLATVYGIVKQHEGNIWVYSEEGNGTTFKVYLPVVHDESIPEDQDHEQPADLHGHETILIAEDNEQVRQLVRTLLEKHGYTVLEAGDGDEAISVCASYSGVVSLLLTDVVMPSMNGRDLYKRLAQDYPEIKVVYMSGYSNNVIAHRGVLEEGVHFLQKPFSNKAFITKVKEVLIS